MFFMFLFKNAKEDFKRQTKGLFTEVYPHQLISAHQCGQR